MQTKIINEKMKRYCRRVLGRIRRIGLKNRDFTIISNNCTGGYIYQHFGLRYNTPTAGLFFSTKDFVKFCKDIKHYLDCEIKFEELSCSKRDSEERKYPVGMLDDIKIHFLHYKSKEEARDKWERRVARINLKNLCFMYCEQADCESKDLEDYCKIQDSNSICFVYNNYEVERARYCPQVIEKGKGAWTRKIVLGLMPWKKYLNGLKN